MFISSGIPDENVWWISSWKGKEGKIGNLWPAEVACWRRDAGRQDGRKHGRRIARSPSAPFVCSCSRSMDDHREIHCYCDPNQKDSLLLWWRCGHLWKSQFAACNMPTMKIGWLRFFWVPSSRVASLPSSDWGKSWCILHAQEFGRNFSYFFLFLLLATLNNCCTPPSVD